MDLNGTTPHISPPVPKPEFPGYYALVPLVLLILVGGAVAVVRIPLEELRHRLIPLYTYDPAEDEDDWVGKGGSMQFGKDVPAPTNLTGKKTKKKTDCIPGDVFRLQLH
uniref:Small integral membrane protein 29 n=1 Tax=Salarias fasciatus TaxID=181472 RepID=A0A672ID41_SALFA